MKKVLLGSAVRMDNQFAVYNVPEGSKFLFFNPVSKEIVFEVEDKPEAPKEKKTKSRKKTKK